MRSFIATTAVLGLSLAAPLASAQTAAPAAVAEWRHVATTSKDGCTLYEYRGEGNNILRYMVQTVPKGTFESWKANERAYFIRTYVKKSKDQLFPYTIDKERQYQVGVVRGVHLEMVINNHKRNVSFAFWVGKDGAWHMIVAYNRSEHRSIDAATVEAVKAFSSR